MHYYYIDLFNTTIIIISYTERKKRAVSLEVCVEYNLSDPKK